MFPCKFNTFQTAGVTRNVNYGMIYGFQSVIVKDTGLLVNSSKTLLKYPTEGGTKFLRKSITLYQLTRHQIPEERNPPHMCFVKR